MDINFELYKIFYYAATAGSFSAAAEKLFISQSAVSQALKNLEDKIGCRLFHRKTRNIKLTGEGELLFKYIEQAYHLIKSGEMKVHEMKDLNLGEVRIGVSDTICKYYLVDYIEKFSQKYPGVKIRVVNRTSLQITTLLKSGLIDLGIVTLPVYEDAVEVQEFKNVEDIFVACSKYSELKNSVSSLKKLSEYPLLMLPKSSITRQNLDRFLSSHGMDVTPEIELESMDLLMEFAKIGMGIAYVLKASVLEAISKNILFEVKVDSKLPERKLGIVTMKHVPVSRASSEFIRYITNSP